MKGVCLAYFRACVAALLAIGCVACDGTALPDAATDGSSPSEASKPDAGADGLARDGLARDGLAGGDPGVLHGDGRGTFRTDVSVADLREEIDLAPDELAACTAGACGARAR